MPTLVWATTPLPERPCGTTDTAVHGAGFQGRDIIMRYLIREGLDVRDVHADGFEAIHRACWGGSDEHTSTVKVLLEAGVPVDAAAADGTTPLQNVKSNAGTRKLLEEWIALKGAVEL